MDFSVIVCCYNPNIEKLKKTIISIEKQQNVDFDIIISDDGSKFKYENEIKEWAKINDFGNIKYNFLKENVGTVKNLISAFEVSNGKYIKVISPGDYLFNENSLKKYKVEFEKKGYSLLFSRAVYYNEQGEILNLRAPQLGSTERGGKHLKTNVCFSMDFLLGASMACKREMKKYLDEISGTVRLMEDFPLSYLALMNGEKVGFIKDYMIWYEHGSGVSTSNSGKILRDDYLKFFNYLKTHYLNNKEIQKSLKIMECIFNPKPKITALQLAFKKPICFINYMYLRFFNKKRKPKVEFSNMYKITTLEQ